MTPTEGREVLTLVFAAWATQRQRMGDVDSKALAAAYMAGLADLDFELVRASVSRLVRTATWMPTVAEIREAAGVLVHGVQKTGAEAWGSVTRAIGEKGSHRTPGVDFTFNDPITRRVVSALGWSNLCKSEDLTPDRARFIDAYEQIAKNERVEAKASAGLASKAFSPEDLPVAIEGAPAQKQLPSPDERSAMLRDVLTSARREQPERFGELANSVFKTYVTDVETAQPDDEVH